MSDTTDTAPEGPASQDLAWNILGPEFMGFVLSILFTGACFQKAAACYRKDSTLSKNNKRILTVVLVILFLYLANTTAEVMLWSTTQDRTASHIYGFYIPDAYPPILSGIISTIVQSFFAHRAWLIVNRSLIFATTVALLITATLAGAIATGVVQLLNTSGTTSFTLLLIVLELWTWSAALTDLVISGVIIFGLLAKKTGFDTASDGLVMRIVNAAMHSASMTTTLAITAAIIYAIQAYMAAAAVNLVFLEPLPAVYTYSLLWCLDSTDQVRKEQRTRATGARSTATGESFTAVGSPGAGGSDGIMSPLGNMHRGSLFAANKSRQRSEHFDMEQIMGEDDEHVYHDEEKGIEMPATPVAYRRGVLNNDFSDVVKQDGDLDKDFRVRISALEREGSGSTMGSTSTPGTRRAMSFAEMLVADNKANPMPK